MNWLTQKLKRFMIKDSFSKDVLALSGSNLVVQILTLATLPIITRIYTPEDFGVLAIFSAIVQIITCIATLRYEIPIPNTQTNRNAYNLIMVCAINAVVTTAITLLCIILFKQTGIEFQSLNSLGGYIWLLPLGVLACCSFNVLHFYAIRERQFTMMAKARFDQSLIAIVTQVGFGLLLKGSLGLILGYLMQTGVGGLRFIKHLASNQTYDDKSVNTNELKKTYYEHSAYFKYSTPEALSQMGALQLPLVIIGVYVSAVEAGLLFMAIRIMQLPVAVISSSFSHVFSGSAPEYFKKGKLNELFLKTVQLMLKWAILPIFLLSIACWLFFPHLLGQEWARAGNIAIWLAAAVCFQSLSSSTGVALYVSSNERLAFFVQLAGFIIRVLPTTYCALYYPDYASYTYAISGALHYFIYFIAISIVCATTKEQYWELLRKFSSNIFLWMLPVLGVVAIVQLAYR
jgi:O-antigen/teichoic acid export membrane protein